MVAEYARVYENNQVIAKPPMKMPHESSLGSAIHSFYSDIASIEQKTTADIEKEKIELRLVESIPSPIAQVPPLETESATVEAIKERKKKKVCY
jgi:transcriptional regulator